MFSENLIRKLKEIVGAEGVLHRPEDLMLYEYDGGLSTGSPQAVVFPRNTEQVVGDRAAGLGENGSRLCRAAAGTGLSGGAIPRNGGIVLAFSRMNRILEFDLRQPARRGAAGRGQSGVVAGSGTLRGLFRARSLQPEGLHHRRQRGGELGRAAHPDQRRDRESRDRVEVVLPDGAIVQFGGKAADRLRLRSDGIFIGSEGTVGIATAITVKLTRCRKRWRLCWPSSTRWTMRPNGDRNYRPRASHRPRWRCWMVDAALRGGSYARGISAGCRRGAADRTGRIARGGERAGGGRCAGLPEPGGARGSPRRDAQKSATCCGRDARTRSVRWGGWLRHITRRMGWCRAPALPRCCAS